MFASTHRVLAVVGLMVAALFAPVAGVATAVGDPDVYKVESEDEKRVDCGKQDHGPGQMPERGKEQGQGQGQTATRPGSPLKINGFDLLDLRLLHYLRDWNDNTGKCTRTDGRDRRDRKDEQDPRRRFDILSFSER
ncbi:hypothetical protein [Streptomyces sp. XD-27]|uniref:hypothetical protein n=1 Tax=Streptomyces sp. XD-27 TaxID=3062779 RepID=UPI0026F43D76|nr:hypothetical protein [Streptomyces sp. XD-27]WKX71063.1 hypothetical protein Q3Y56_15110 [Streptomyces sp. XD-27]